MDWLAIKNEYINTEISMRKLAEKYNANVSTLTKKACRERWIEQRQAVRDRVAMVMQQKTADKTVAKTVARIDRINSITDRLLDKIDKAVDELDLKIVANVVKTKTVEQIGETEDGTPLVGEVQKEERTFDTIRLTVDKSGLRQLTAALKDIKEIKGVKAELDTKEQEARIAALQATTAKNAIGVADDTETGVIVIAPVIADEDGDDSG